MLQYIRWDVVAMYIALIIVFGFEMLGVFTHNYITITAIARHYLPVWLRVMLCAWLFWHFCIAPVNYQ